MYKLKKIYYLREVLAIITIVLFMVILHSAFLAFFMGIGVIVMVIDLINKISLCFIVDDNKLSQKTLFKSKIILYFKDVTIIAKSATKPNDIVIVAENNNFIISPLIQDYKGLLRDIIKNCNNTISIEPQILEL